MNIRKHIDAFFDQGIRDMSRRTTMELFGSGSLLYDREFHARLVIWTPIIQSRVDMGFGCYDQAHHILFPLT